MIQPLVLTLLVAQALLAQEATGISRWTMVDRATVGLRYIGANRGDLSQLQHQEVFRGGIRFDKASRFSLKSSLATGPYFSGGWNHTPAGSQPGLGRLFWRELFLSAQPIRGVELAYGGMGLEPNGTGLAGLAGVGYVTGQRLVIRRPEFGLDRVAVTYGYLGDFNQPGMESRFRRLGRANFRDLIVEKRIRRLTLSSQVTSFGGRSVLSVGATVALPGESVGRWEYYHRSRLDRANGFHAGFERNFHERLTAGGGYVSVDPNFGRLNSDAFWDGRRWYASATVPLQRGMNINLLYNKAVGNDVRPTIGNFVMAGVTYDLLTLLKK